MTSTAAHITIDHLSLRDPTGAALFDGLDDELMALFPAELRAAVEAAAEFEEHHLAELTVKGQSYMWAAFSSWCNVHGFTALPAAPRVVAVYIGHLATTGGRVDETGTPAGRKASTVAQHVSTIRSVHKEHDHADPTADPYTRRVLRGLRRVKTHRTTRREPMVLQRLFEVIDTIDNRSIVPLCDHVIVAADAADAVESHGAITAAQLARLDWNDVSVCDHGVAIEMPARGNSSTRTTITLPVSDGPLCLASALLALAGGISERIDAEAARSAAGPVGAATWSAVFGPVDRDGLPSTGPVLAKLNRHGVLQEGRPTRNQVATRLSRAAHLVGVTCGRQARPRWNDDDRCAAVVALHEPRLADLRDRALLLVGFALAARRSNLSMLNLGEVTEHTEGLMFHFRRDKTDQYGQGRDVEVPRRPGRYCPVEAWNQWEAALLAKLDFVPEDIYPAFPALDHSGTRVAGPRAVYKVRKGTVLTDEDGEPIVSHWEGICGDEINNIVKRRAAAAGLSHDPTTGVRLKWGGHSLRRGWMTEAARQGISLERMMAHSGHVTVEVALEYIAEAKRFDPQHSAAMQLRFEPDTEQAPVSASGAGQRQVSPAQEAPERWRGLGERLRTGASRPTAPSRPSGMPGNGSVGRDGDGPSRSDADGDAPNPGVGCRTRASRHDTTADRTRR